MNQIRLARYATPIAVVILLAIGAFGVYLRFVDASPLPIDEWWASFATTTRGSAAYAVAVFFAEAGSSLGVAALGAIAAALLFVLRRRRAAGMVATALLLGVASSETLKRLVLRPRPGGALYAASGSSYPSGHSMGAAALACSLALVVVTGHAVSRRMQRVAWAVAITWILLMMWSRTALRVHWLSDTVAGALLGFAVALVALRVWAPREVEEAPATRRRLPA